MPSPPSATTFTIHPNDFVNLSHHYYNSQALPGRQSGVDISKQPPMSTQSHTSSSTNIGSIPPLSSSSSSTTDNSNSDTLETIKSSPHKQKEFKDRNVKSSLKDQLLKSKSTNSKLTSMTPRPASRITCRWNNCSNLIHPTTKDLREHINQHLNAKCHTERCVCRWANHDIPDTPCLKIISYTNFVGHLKAHLRREGQPSSLKTSERRKVSVTVDEQANSINHLSERPVEMKIQLEERKPPKADNVQLLLSVFPEPDSKIICK